MITEFEGKVAVITGAGSGIGRGLVLGCRHAGMHVVAADVEEAALDETVALARGGTIGVVTDVSDGAQVAALADRAYDEFGAVHLLCNNAGVFQAGVIWERTVADWEWVLGVNVWGIIHGIRAFVPRMIAQNTEGHVVNTSSLAGLVTNAFSGPYNVSKFAAVALTESLAHDLASTTRDRRIRAGAGRGRHAHRRVSTEPTVVARRWRRGGGRGRSSTSHWPRSPAPEPSRRGSPSSCWTPCERASS